MSGSRRKLVAAIVTILGALALGPPGWAEGEKTDRRRESDLAPLWADGSKVPWESFDCEAEDEDVDGDGVPNDDDPRYPIINSGPSVADLPILRVTAPSPSVAISYVQSRNPLRMNPKKGDVRFSSQVTSQPEIRATFRGSDLEALLWERFGDERNSPLFRLAAPPTLSYFHASAISFASSLRSMTESMSTDWIELDPFGGTVTVTLEVARLAGEAPFLEGPLEVILVSYDRHGQRTIWTRPISVSLGTFLYSGTFEWPIAAEVLNAYELWLAVEAGELFTFEIFRSPRMTYQGPEPDLPELLEESAAKTALFVRKGIFYDSTLPPGLLSREEPFFARIAVRSPYSKECISLREMLRMYFGQSERRSISFSSAENHGWEISKIGSYRNSFDFGESFRRWIVGVYSERDLPSITWDMPLRPGDEVVLYLIRGEDLMQSSQDVSGEISP